jgi:hypothetical protein
MGALLQNQSHATPSTRLDWWSGTFRLHSREDLWDLKDYLRDLGERVLPGSGFGEPGKGRFYKVRERHPSGLQIQYSAGPPAAGGLVKGSNDGLASVEIPGQVWGFLDPGLRRDLIGDLRGCFHLVRTTRLDLQTTLLDPEQDAAWIVREVAAGRLWPKGFGVGMAYANRNLHGDLHGACTQYFGGKESDVRSRHYDKAAEARWEIPAVRHEVQLRNDAADQWFRRMADRCQAEPPLGPLLMTAEAATVKDALGSLVDFRDTSRWEGRRKPRNWARTAEVPVWWSEIVGPSPTPLAVEYRPPGDLEASLAAMVDQYGRKWGLWLLLEALKASQAVPVSATDVALRCIARLDPGDWKVLAQLAPGADPARIREWFATSVENARTWAERPEAPETTTPPC